MGARQKINIAVFNGCVIGAAIMGGICASWGAFWVTLAILVGLACYGRDIRLKRGR